MFNIIFFCGFITLCSLIVGYCVFNLGEPDIKELYKEMIKEKTDRKNND